jgi:hypothetical protein
VVNFTTVFKVVKFIPFCILAIGPDDGQSLLAETCSLILTDRNAVLAERNTRFFFNLMTEMGYSTLK